MKFVNNRKAFRIYNLVAILIFLGFNILYLVNGESSLPFNILILIALIIGLFIGLIKKKKNIEQSEYLKKILYEDMDIERYIDEIQALINKYKNRNKQIQSYYYTYLTLGYAAKGEFRECIDIYENKIIYRDKAKFKAILYNNLTYYYCEIEDLENAIRTFNESEKYFNMYLNDPRLKGSFLRTLGLIEYLKGNLVKAEELLEKAKVQKIDANLKQHYIAGINIYLAKIFIKTDRIKNARILIDYNLSQKLLPYQSLITNEVNNKIKILENKE